VLLRSDDGDRLAFRSFRRLLSGGDVIKLFFLCRGESKLKRFSVAGLFQDGLIFTSKSGEGCPEVTYLH
jgi:hypothetical protein